MRSINKERLIELAEGRLAPTAEEQRLLQSDQSLRQELERLRGIFTALRSLPDPAIDQDELDKLVPAIRTKLRSLRRPSLPAWLKLRPAFSHALAAAASFLFIIGTILLVGVNDALQPEREQPAAEVLLAPDFELDNETEFESLSDDELLVEASALSELELFPELEEDIDSDFSYYFGDSLTSELMESAASDESALAFLEGMLVPDRESYDRIVKALSRREL